ncbi:MAG: VOC family protein [Egibacteraceae bacterium]
MTDPLEALREPVRPEDPNPRFAAALRARLERALLDTRGAVMTATTLTAADVPLHTLTPYLAVDDARRALDFYTAAFGAVRRGEPIVMEDGRIGHAEVAIGDSVLMLADEFEEIGLLGPVARGGPSQTMRLEVANVDATVRRAVDAGAVLTRPVADYAYGRNGVVNDPFGHRWMIASAVPGVVTPVSGTGARVGYASLWTPDADRAAAFYGAVLGWRYAPGSAPQGRQVMGVTPRLGIWGGQERGTTFLCFVVADVPVAVQRVRAAGGQAEEPTLQPYGLIANCADDQGMAFAIVEGPQRELGRRASMLSTHRDPTPAGSAAARSGELAYLTIEVADSSRFRDFFGTVLGLRFTPGRMEDGWGIVQTYPMAGMHGGHERSTVVPMFAVDDVAAAVTRVRAAGGTATDPVQMPYGITSDCADDQGTRFYLGQL